MAEPHTDLTLTRARAGGVALYADGCAYQDGRSHYEHAEPPDGRLHWVCDTA
ncbi:hypothetical protein [Streptomyces sp. SID3343]|uniref:hypothetical protein n=1 Tax=Streptomyces sp. SID3343 TaxID=2690260 RepID=UPI00136EC28D|nr:hypothetical protein [Streptomyces sp. SID3343]MYW00371.1 hypothetical protein [Streptomyces sp. SID3343]